MNQPTAQDIDALLPQTQCRRCGYDGCLPYARAIADGTAAINRCPPGGDATTAALAKLTGQAAQPLADDCAPVARPLLAFIRADECIGCTKCIQVCPVDAILGAAKQLHTVLETECTGCELCVPACPVDCIDMPAASQGTGQVHWPPQSVDDRQRAGKARRRFNARNTRLQRLQAEKIARRARKRQPSRSPSDDPHATRKAEIGAAIERAKARRVQRQQQHGQTHE